MGNNGWELLKLQLVHVSAASFDARGAYASALVRQEQSAVRSKLPWPPTQTLHLRRLESVTRYDFRFCVGGCMGSDVGTTSIVTHA